MKRKTSIYTTVITTGTVLNSLPVFAHSDHFEKNSDTTESTSTQQNSTSSSSASSPMENQPEETPSQSTSSQQKTTSSPINQPEMENMENNHHEETQAVEAQSTTQSQLLTIGKVPALGETIFSLMLAAPFLLYAARKRIHQS